MKEHGPVRKKKYRNNPASSLAFLKWNKEYSLQWHFLKFLSSLQYFSPTVLTLNDAIALCAFLFYFLHCFMKIYTDTLTTANLLKVKRIGIPWVEDPTTFLIKQWSKRGLRQSGSEWQNSSVIKGASYGPLSCSIWLAVRHRSIHLISLGIIYLYYNIKRITS